jgi:hypothetical protein
MPLLPNTLIDTSSPDVLTSYKKAIVNDLTTDAVADAMQSRWNRYDVGVWIALSDGSSPGLLVVVTSLSAGQLARLDIAQHGWAVQKQQWFWYVIVNGQRVIEQSPLWDAGPGYYYPRLDIKWASRNGSVTVEEALQPQAALKIGEDAR